MLTLGPRRPPGKRGQRARRGPGRGTDVSNSNRRARRFTSVVFSGTQNGQCLQTQAARLSCDQTPLLSHPHEAGLGMSSPDDNNTCLAGARGDPPCGRAHPLLSRLFSQARLRAALGRTGGVPWERSRPSPGPNAATELDPRCEKRSARPSGGGGRGRGGAIV